MAEVLITLTVLGVIAAITIPGIHRKWQDAYTIVAVRKSYAMFDSAFQQMFLIEGKPITWDWPIVENTSFLPKTNADNNKYFLEKLSKYLKITKFCYNASDGCFNYGIPVSNWFPTVLLLNGEYYNNGGLEAGANNNIMGMILANGMHVTFRNIAYYDSHSSGLGGDGYRGIATMQFDINGPKGPNRWGYDIFSFDFDSNGIILDDPKTTGKRSTRAAISGVYGKDQCSSKSANGKTCALWIMRHGNVDYKYRDVSADW